MKKHFIALLFLASPQVFAWGPVAHRATGVIADSRLSLQASAAVKSLLGTDSLGDIANWADAARSSGKYTQTVWYHFEKIPDGLTFMNNLNALPDWQRKKGGTVMAILEANHVLRNSVVAVPEKIDALKFLVHFIGDLHQPLHSGRPEDNGGVKTDVAWFGTAMNLHRIWDSGMIGTGHGELASAPDGGTAYANYLLVKFEREPVDLTMNVEKWLNESMSLRLAAYDLSYQSDQSGYQTRHLPEVDLRVYSAGVRIAALLNDIFAGMAIPASELDLQNKIEAVVGNLNSLIYFRP
ncbi:MAG: S1/P1 nuclease [Bdellovibrionales bacterium]